MSREQGSCGFDLRLALEERDDEIAERISDGDQDAEREALPPGDTEQQRPGHRAGNQSEHRTADQALPRLLRADARPQLVLPERAAREIGPSIVNPGDAARH